MLEITLYFKHITKNYQKLLIDKYCLIYNRLMRPTVLITAIIQPQKTALNRKILPHQNRNKNKLAHNLIEL